MHISKYFRPDTAGGSYLLLALSALFSNLLFGATAFPYLGWSLLLAISATVVFLLKKERSTWLNFLYASALMLSFFITYRANPSLTFFNSVAVIYIGAMMLSLTKEQGLIDLAIAPVSTFFRSLIQRHTYLRTVRDNAASGSAGKRGTFVGLAISAALLAVVLPLLSSANPIFAQWLNALANFLSIERLIEQFFSGIDVFVLQILGWVFFAFIIPRMLLFSNSTKKPYITVSLSGERYSLLIPKIVMTAVLAIFFISQTQLYFADAAMLQNLGYTNSQYAREVFGQLFVVGLLLLGLLYNDQQRSKNSRIISALLLAELVFLTLIGLKSVIDYSALYGLTFKRLWGYAGIAWMFSALGIFGYWYYRKLSSTFFVRSISILSIAILLAINIVNFDRLIFLYRPTTAVTGVDYSYLVSLSTDAGIYSQLYNQLHERSDNAVVDQSNPDAWPPERWDFLRVAETINKLQYEYTDQFNWRSFNWSRYQEYQRVKNVPVAEDINYSGM